MFLDVRRESFLYVGLTNMSHTGAKAAHLCYLNQKTKLHFILLERKSAPGTTGKESLTPYSWQVSAGYKWRQKGL